MRKLLVTAAAVLPLLLGVAAYAAAGGGQSDLAEVRDATAAFHDLDAAKRAGYTLELPDVNGNTCIANLGDPGAGAMGVHMVNPTLLNDGGTIDPTKPEALVYERRSDGTLKLAAVEYVAFQADVPRPSLFNVQFDANDGTRIFPANDPHPFWALHAWIWKPNPTPLTGIFSPWNPRVTC
jgi:hypothetical protein